MTLSRDSLSSKFCLVLNRQRHLRDCPAIALCWPITDDPACCNVRVVIGRLSCVIPRFHPSFEARASVSIRCLRVPVLDDKRPSRHTSMRLVVTHQASAMFLMMILNCA